MKTISPVAPILQTALLRVLATAEKVAKSPMPEKPVAPPAAQHTESPLVSSATVAVLLSISSAEEALKEKRRGHRHQKRELDLLDAVQSELKGDALPSDRLLAILAALQETRHQASAALAPLFDSLMAAIRSRLTQAENSAD